MSSVSMRAEAPSGMSPTPWEHDSRSLTSSPRLQLGGSSAGFDSAVVERVLLYLKVSFGINVFLTCVASTLFLLGSNFETRGADVRGLVVAVAITGASGIAWLILFRGVRSVAVGHAVADVMTFVFSAGATYITAGSPETPYPARAVLFALIIVTVVLVLRSSLIPSPALLTAGIGLVCVAPPVLAAFLIQAEGGGIFPTWVSTMSVVVVVVTTVTSSTVYGMQQRVQAASQLGQYQIIRRLGQGSMGEVYLAEHALLRRPTAIKLLRNASASGRAMFRHEVQAASTLTHPNTVEIYDYGRTPEGLFYFAMEFIDGANLDELVRTTGSIPAARVLHLLGQAAGALSEAHARGLVHRDIKPSNLMLCERGGRFDTLKVLDFGLVRDIAEESADLTELTGTPLYLAPEMILEGDGASPQSDVYALGATAYFMLSGQPPFPGDDLVEILSDHLAAEPAALHCEDPSLEALIMSCLSKDPLKRPMDASTLLDRLEQCPCWGLWSSQEAAVWWSEHREVIRARRQVTGEERPGQSAST